MADKDFTTCGEWNKFVPTLTERDMIIRWCLAESGALVYEAEAGKEIFQEWDRSRKALREARWALKSNLRRIELERIVRPILVGSRCDYSGTEPKNISARVEEEMQRRSQLVAEAGLTPEQFKAMNQELEVLERPLSKAEAAFQDAEKRQENYQMEAHSFANAVCFSEGKREGFRAGIRHLLLNRDALQGKDVLARIMMAMLDDKVADHLIADLTEHDTPPLWPDEQEEAAKFFHGSDAAEASEE